MKRFRILCLLGFIGSLVVWILPASCKPYHIKRDLDDWKILLVEQDSEWGFAANGIVKVRTSLAFGGTRAALAPVRREYIAKVERSRVRWPVDSRKIRYDEWGPSRTYRENDIEVTQVGTVFCVPYSVFAICFALPLIWQILLGTPRKKIPQPEMANIDQKS